MFTVNPFSKGHGSNKHVCVEGSRGGGWGDSVFFFPSVDARNHFNPSLVLFLASLSLLVAMGTAERSHHSHPEISRVLQELQKLHQVPERSGT